MTDELLTEFFWSHTIVVWTAAALLGLVIVTVAVRRYRSATFRVVALNERCEAAYADIDAHLKHRHNLIPPLVETVRGFASHERDIVLGVTRAQADAIAAASPEDSAKTEKALTVSLNALLASAQRLPEVQASSHFVALRNELIDCENRVTAARRFYNIVCAEYNASTRQWPASLAAGRANLARRTAYDLGEERAAIDRPAAIAF